MSIGERIFAVRKHLGINQTDFGKEILLSQTAIGQIENNTRTATDRTILLVSSKFKVSESWLRTGEGEMFENVGDDFISELAAKYQLNTFQKNLVRAVYEMPPAYQEMILSLAHRLVAESEEESEEDIAKRDFRTARAARDAEEDHNADERA